MTNTTADAHEGEPSMTTTNHPLTEDRAAELWEVHIPERKTEYLGWQSFPEPSRRHFTTILRAAFDAGREHEREHTDPRPWQDCTRKDIRKGDLVEARDGGRLVVSVALTPPAVEVELPTEHPAHITDVEGWSGDVCAYMALDRDGFWTGVGGGGSACAWEGDDIAAFTLPDGTRARRDGECEDGTPRFVKEDSK